MIAAESSRVPEWARFVGLIPFGFVVMRLAVGTSTYDRYNGPWQKVVGLLLESVGVWLPILMLAFAVLTISFRFGGDWQSKRAFRHSITFTYIIIVLANYGLWYGRTHP